MAALLVRNLDEDVKTRLIARAKRNGRSLEAEARKVLIEAAHADEPTVGLGTQIRAMFAEFNLTEMDFEPVPRQIVEPISFDE